MNGRGELARAKGTACASLREELARRQQRGSEITTSGHQTVPVVGKNTAVFLSRACGESVCHLM